MKLLKGTRQISNNKQDPRVDLSFLLFVILILSCPILGNAQSLVNEDFLKNSLVRDINGDGQVLFAHFGDSIARGTGDFIASGQEIDSTSPPSGEAGTPLRIETYLGIPVRNLGVPGEKLSTQGLTRFAKIIPGLGADVVIITGGSNDALFQVSIESYHRSLQTMINIARASNTEPVITTITPSCCDRAGLTLFTTPYNRDILSLANSNEIVVASVFKAFSNTCAIGNCFLLNLPEGLHPNIEGYDVMGETVIAALLRINIFAPDGPATLEQALNLPAGSVRTKPDPVASDDA